MWKMNVRKFFRIIQVIVMEEVFLKNEKLLKINGMIWNSCQYLSKMKAA